MSRGRHGSPRPLPAVDPPSHLDARGTEYAVGGFKGILTTWVPSNTPGPTSQHHGETPVLPRRRLLREQPRSLTRRWRRSLIRRGSELRPCFVFFFFFPFPDSVLPRRHAAVPRRLVSQVCRGTGSERERKNGCPPCPRRRLAHLFRFGEAQIPLAGCRAPDSSADSCPGEYRGRYQVIAWNLGVVEPTSASDTRYHEDDGAPFV